MYEFLGIAGILAPILLFVAVLAGYLPEDGE